MLVVGVASPESLTDGAAGPGGGGAGGSGTGVNCTGGGGGGMRPPTELMLRTGSKVLSS